MYFIVMCMNTYNVKKEDTNPSHKTLGIFKTEGPMHILRSRAPSGNGFSRVEIRRHQTFISQLSLLKYPLLFGFLHFAQYDKASKGLIISRNLNAKCEFVNKRRFQPRLEHGMENLLLCSGEISPTRCNNCVFYPQWLYSTCFG